MTRKTVRRLFIVLLILLPLQFALGLVIHHQTDRSPWPIIGIVDVFEEADGTDPHTVRYPMLSFTVDGEPIEQPAGALLENVPQSLRLGFFRSMCQPESLSGTGRTERCLDPDAAPWIRERLVPLHPGLEEAEPDELHVVWSELFYDPNPEGIVYMEVETTTLDTLSISL